MGLTSTLRRIGGKLGILHVAELPPPPAEPHKKVPTRRITLSEMVTTIRAQEVRALAELPAELSVDFEKVFATAGVVTPAHGWTIERLRQLLLTEQYKDMDRPAAQKAILGLLAAEKAPVEDLVKDAMARDQAIDAFAAFVKKKFDDRVAARQRQVADLEAQIKELHERCARLREESKADRECWRQWHQRKSSHEKEMAWAIGYLLDRPIVSIDAGDSV